MFCTNCGANNNEGAKFCTKCGQQLSYSSAVDNAADKKKGKSRNVFMISISLVLVATIVTISVFDLWPWSNGTDKEWSNETRNDMGSAQDKENPVSNDEMYSFESFSLDAIVDECPDCQSAIETYIEMIKVGQDWTTSKEELEMLENQKCNQMQHLCTAKIIQVENVPYVFRGGFGLYTGDWMGAGPCGKGSFSGTTYGNIVTYDGDWGFGVPNGEGELYAENGYLRGWDTTYTGKFKNGMRDGVGSWFEYYDDSEKAVDPQPRYRIYDIATYSNDMLTDWVNCADYDAETGELLGYCKMTTNETGASLMGERWGADELSPEEKNAFGVAGSLFIAGVVVYMGSEMISSLTDPHYADSIYKGKTPEEQMAELNQYRQQKEKEQEEQKRLEADRLADEKAYANTQLDRWENGEIDAYENDIIYWNSIVYQ
jgi:hypothetical protein